LLDFLFWYLLAGTTILSYFLLRIAGERINQVSLVNVTTVALFLFSVIGTLPLFYYLDDYRYSIGVQDKSLVLKVLFYSCVNVILFLFGVIFVRKIMCLKPVSFRSADIGELSILQKVLLFFVFMLCLSMLLMYLRQVGQVALFTALTDGVEQAKVTRSNMGNSFSGRYHWYKLMMYDIGNILTFLCFAMWLKKKQIFNFVAFLITFSFSSFVALISIEKAPFVWLLVGLFLIYFLVRADGFIPLRKLAFFAVLIVVILMAFFSSFYGAVNIASSLSSVFSRAFAGSIEPAYFYLKMFPEYKDFLYGETLPNPSGLFPFEPYRYTVEVANWVYPTLEDRGIVGTMPAVYWGEAYINFGWSGVVLISFVVGVVLGLFSYLLSKIEINPMSIAFFVWLILLIKDLSVTGFSAVFFNVYLYFGCFLFLFVMTLQRKISLRSGA